MSLFDAFFPAAYAAGPPQAAASGSAGCGCGCSGSVEAPPTGAPTVQVGPEDGRERLLARTLNAWATERPGALGVFAELGLDACCGGARSLSEACRLHGLDAGAVLDRLGALPRAERR